MRLYLPRVEARLRDITALWFCRKKGHLHTLQCNEQEWDKELARVAQDLQVQDEGKPRDMAPVVYVLDKVKEKNSARSCHV